MILRWLLEGGYLNHCLSLGKFEQSISSHHIWSNSWPRQSNSWAKVTPHMHSTVAVLILPSQIVRIFNNKKLCMFCWNLELEWQSTLCASAIHLTLMVAFRLHLSPCFRGFFLHKASVTLICSHICSSCMILGFSEFVDHLQPNPG